MWTTEQRSVIQSAVAAYLAAPGPRTAHGLVEHVAQALSTAGLACPTFSALDLVPWLPPDALVEGLDTSVVLR